MSLSKIQKKIVNTSGNLMVSASAGTGKTHTMVAKIAREIEENRTHKTIAAITFTIKAAQEIKDRLTTDAYQHFIGTNNSFAIEEIIKPFMKDVYGSEYDIDMSTDYSAKVATFDDGIDKIKSECILCSYQKKENNFVFDLALSIVKQSSACQLYLKSKYFKIYIDEYQDCDKSMHELFMYICDELKIETFIVGDEKQSIYMWRGAYPEAFVSIKHKPNFKNIFMGENHRSCQQIQNYSNLLFDNTASQYTAVSNLNSIIILTAKYDNWANKIVPLMDINAKTAILRYSNDNAGICAHQLSDNGFECVYIPVIPINEITTNSAWIYMEIAKYIIIDTYSVYDVISEIPVEGDTSKKVISKIEEKLINICKSTDDKNEFYTQVNMLAEYLGYQTRNDHIGKLYKTIKDPKYHPAFYPDKYRHTAITFHSSKGLEFEQVVLFAEDYNLSDNQSLYNHYVAVTRAKNKLIIVYINNQSALSYYNNMKKILSKKRLDFRDILTIV